MKIALFLICPILTLSICCSATAAEDYTQFSLPESAITRLGKGTLGEVRFSPDGSRLAVCSSVGIWLYDPQTGKEVDLLVRTDSVYPFPFAYSPDGKTIATGSRDKTWVTTGPRGSSISPVRDFTVQLWDVTTGEEKATLRGHERRIYAISYSPDGATIATAGGRGDNTVYLWDTATGKSKGMLERHTGSVNAVVYSPDGNTIATASSDDTVRLWDATTAKHKTTLTGHAKRVNAVVYSPDGNTIATASSDDTVRLWDVRTRKHKITLRGHTDSVSAVVYSPDGNTIVSTSSDKTVRLWNAHTGKHEATFTGHTDRVTSVAYSPNGKTIATVSGGRHSNDSTVRLWNTKTGETQAVLIGHHHINAIAYASDGETLTCQQMNGVRSWDAKTGKHKTTRIHKVKDTSTEYSHAGGISAYSPDGSMVATVGSLDTVQLLDARTRKRKATLKHTNYLDWIYMMVTDREYGIDAMAFSPDGNTIVTGGGYYTNDEGMVYLWHTRTRKRKTIYKGHGYVSSVAFSPDGGTIAAGNWENEVRLWHAVTGEELQTIHTRHKGGVLSLMYSPDGTTIATGGGYTDTTVHLLDANTGTLKTILKGHTDGVTSIVYSPDGNMIATGSRDGTVRLWETDTGKHKATFTGHTEVTSVVYSPDGRTLASRNTDGTVLLWEITPTPRTE